MEEFTAVGAVNDLKPGTMKEVEVKGKKVLLARIGDKTYAAEGSLPAYGRRPGKWQAGREYRHLPAPRVAV